MTKRFFDPCVVWIPTVGTGVRFAVSAVVGAGNTVVEVGDGGIASVIVGIGVAVGRMVADGGVGEASMMAVNVGVRGASVTVTTGSVGVGVNVACSGVSVGCSGVSVGVGGIGVGWPGYACSGVCVGVGGIGVGVGCPGSSVGVGGGGVGVAVGGTGVDVDVGGTAVAVGVGAVGVGVAIPASGVTSQIMVLNGNKPLYKLVTYRPSGNAPRPAIAISMESVPAPV
jgi:hypothetical protein